MAITPVRCFGLSHPNEVELTEAGVVENRRFVLVGADGSRLRSSVTYWPIPLSARYDAGREVLAVRFPDGAEVEGSALELSESSSRRSATARCRRGSSRDRGRSGWRAWPGARYESPAPTCPGPRRRSR